MLILNSRLLKKKKKVKVYQKEALVRKIVCLMLVKASLSLFPRHHWFSFWSHRKSEFMRQGCDFTRALFTKLFLIRRVVVVFFFQNASVEDTVYFLCLFTTHLHTHTHTCALTNAH